RHDRWVDLGGGSAPHLRPRRRAIGTADEAGRLMFVDFSSRPPTAPFDTGMVAALKNDRSVYREGEARAGAQGTRGDALADYLAMYRRLDAKAVVVKARDTRSNFGAHIRNDDVAAFCRAHGRRWLRDNARAFLGLESS